MSAQEQHSSSDLMSNEGTAVTQNKLNTRGSRKNKNDFKRYKFVR